ATQFTSGSAAKTCLLTKSGGSGNSEGTKLINGFYRRVPGPRDRDGTLEAIFGVPMPIFTVGNRFEAANQSTLHVYRPLRRVRRSLAWAHDGRLEGIIFRRKRRSCLRNVEAQFDRLGWCSQVRMA